MKGGREYRHVAYLVVALQCEVRAVSLLELYEGLARGAPDLTQRNVHAVRHNGDALKKSGNVCFLRLPRQAAQPRETASLRRPLSSLKRHGSGGDGALNGRRRCICIALYRILRRVRLGICKLGLKLRVVRRVLGHAS